MVVTLLRRLLLTGIPLAIILAYRLIPARIRHIWSFGTSSSHLALAHPSWRALGHYSRFKLASPDGGWPDSWE